MISPFPGIFGYGQLLGGAAVLNNRIFWMGDIYGLPLSFNHINPEDGTAGDMWNVLGDGGPVATNFGMGLIENQVLMFSPTIYGSYGTIPVLNQKTGHWRNRNIVLNASSPPLLSSYAYISYNNSVFF